MSMESLDRALLEEGANWIAEMISDDFNGFVPAELIDLLMELEQKIRVESNDPQMDHWTMAERMIPVLEGEGVPTEQGGFTAEVLYEIFHWEDQFLDMAGFPRDVRPS